MAFETHLIPENIHFLYFDFFKTYRFRTEKPKPSTTSMEYDCLIISKYLGSISDEKASISIEIPTISTKNLGF